MISVDYGAQPQYWLLFDRIVQQLVLQSESQVDNDVEPLRSVDVKELVQHLAKEEEVIRLRYVSVQCCRMAKFDPFLGQTLTI